MKNNSELDIDYYTCVVAYNLGNGSRSIDIIGQGGVVNIGNDNYIVTAKHLSRRLKDQRVGIEYNDDRNWFKPEFGYTHTYGDIMLIPTERIGLQIEPPVENSRVELRYRKLGAVEYLELRISPSGNTLGDLSEDKVQMVENVYDNRQITPGMSGAIVCNDEFKVIGIATGLLDLNRKCGFIDILNGLTLGEFQRMDF